MVTDPLSETPNDSNKKKTVSKTSNKVVINGGMIGGTIIIGDENNINNLQFDSKKIGSNKDGFRILYLEQCQNFWIDNLLLKSLERGDVGVSAGPAPDNLYFFTKPSYLNTVLPPIGLLELFDKNNGDMLILGNPGSGKTTLMLQLVQILLKRAIVDETQKIPIVINLTEWSSFTIINVPDVDKNPSQDTVTRLQDGNYYRLTLGSFIHKILVEQYKIPAEIANNWIENNIITIFLDGFDEVLESVRPICIKELNIFRNLRSNIPLVVCSRIAEYEQLTDKLHMETVLQVSDLRSEQVQKYLKLLGLKQLVRLHKNEASTAELCRSPFWLGLLIQAYSKHSWALLGVPKDINSRSYDLLENYINLKSGYSLTTASKSQREHAKKLAKLMTINGVSMLSFEKLKESGGWGTLNKAIGATNLKFFTDGLPFLKATASGVNESIKSRDRKMLVFTLATAGIVWIVHTVVIFMKNLTEHNRLEQEYKSQLQEKELAKKEYDDELKSFIEIAEQMVTCGLMRKVGENYIWVHEIIKQHIADSQVDI